MFEPSMKSTAIASRSMRKDSWETPSTPRRRARIESSRLSRKGAMKVRTHQGRAEKSFTVQERPSISTRVTTALATRPLRRSFVGACARSARAKGLVSVMRYPGEAARRRRVP